MNKQGDDDVRIIDPLMATRIVTDLDPYISELELIPIGSDSVDISGIIKMLVSHDKFYLLAGGVVFSMTQNGETSIRVGNLGRGPGEYLMVKDIAFNHEGTELWCLDVTQKILRYEIEKEAYIGSISLGKDIAHAEAIIPLANNSFAIYVPNPLMKDISDENISFYCLRICDYNGKEKSRDLPWYDYNIDAAFSSPVSYSDNGICVLSPESSRPCWVFENGEEKERIMFDFGSKNVPFRYSFRAGGDPMLMLGDLFKEDYYKLVSSVLFVESSIYLRAYGRNSSLWNFYIPNEGIQGIRWQSFGVVTPPKSAIATDHGFLYYEFSDYGEIPLKEERDPLKKYVLKEYGEPPSNKPCLIKVKLDVQ